MLSQFHHAVLNDIKRRLVIADMKDSSFERAFFYANQKVRKFFVRSQGCSETLLQHVRKVALGDAKTTFSLWHWAMALVNRVYHEEFNVIIEGCRTKRVQVWCETPVA
jgi:hypothetical protein